jgi:hypothetical protein
MIQPAKKVVNEWRGSLYVCNYIRHYRDAREREVAGTAFWSRYYSLPESKRPPIESSFTSTCPPLVDQQILMNPIYGMHTDITLHASASLDVSLPDCEREWVGSLTAYSLRKSLEPS